MFIGACCWEPTKCCQTTCKGSLLISNIDAYQKSIDFQQSLHTEEEVTGSIRSQPFKGLSRSWTLYNIIAILSEVLASRSAIISTEFICWIINRSGIKVVLFSVLINTKALVLARLRDIGLIRAYGRIVRLVMSNRVASIIVETDIRSIVRVSAGFHDWEFVWGF